MTAKQYLPRANDPKFGIWYDYVYMIGSKEIEFIYNDIFIEGKNIREHKVWGYF